MNFKEWWKDYVRSNFIYDPNGGEMASAEDSWGAAVEQCIIAINESQPPETTPWDCADAIKNKLLK